MAPRANWKGYLRLSLVSCPIALYPASSLSEKVSFNRINRKTGNRMKQQNVDSETGDVVPREDTARGYEVAKGQVRELLDILTASSFEGFASRPTAASYS
jgi:DNA end-binding protein Ku